MTCINCITLWFSFPIIFIFFYKLWPFLSNNLIIRIIFLPFPPFRFKTIISKMFKLICFYIIFVKTSFFIFLRLLFPKLAILICAFSYFDFQLGINNNIFICFCIYNIFDRLCIWSLKCCYPVAWFNKSRFFRFPLMIDSFFPDFYEILWSVKLGQILLNKIYLQFIIHKKFSNARIFFVNKYILK